MNQELNNLKFNLAKLKAKVILLTGQGRGNWGHQGRPGHVGGSGTRTAKVGEKIIVRSILSDRKPHKVTEVSDLGVSYLTNREPKVPNQTGWVAHGNYDIVE